MRPNGACPNGGAYPNDGAYLNGGACLGDACRDGGACLDDDAGLDAQASRDCRRPIYMPLHPVPSQSPNVAYGACGAFDVFVGSHSAQASARPSTPHIHTLLHDLLNSNHPLGANLNRATSGSDLFALELVERPRHYPGANRGGYNPYAVGYLDRASAPSLAGGRRRRSDHLRGRACAPWLRNDPRGIRPASALKAHDGRGDDHHGGDPHGGGHHCRASEHPR